MNAISKINHPEELIGRSMPDGSLMISPEQLARLGNGDPKRGKRELRLLLAAEKERALPQVPATKPKSVRIATAADAPAIFDMLIADLEENAAAIAPINPGKVAAHVHAGVHKRPNVIGVIDSPDDKPIALIMLIWNQWWWSEQGMYQDQVSYVHPDHRKSNHIDDLLQFARWWVDSMTAAFGYRMYMLTGVLGTKKVREKIILFRRKFATVGIACLYPSPPQE